MKYDYQQTPFSKAILTSLFCGIVATLAVEAFNYFFRLDTGYMPSMIVNVSTIIFACLIVLVVAGLFFYWLNFIKGGRAIFIVLFAAITVLSAWAATGIQRSTDHLVNVQFHWLFSSIIVILGLCSFALMPYLYQSKSFNENVL